MKNEFPHLTLPITAGSEYFQVKLGMAQIRIDTSMRTETRIVWKWAIQHKAL